MLTEQEVNRIFSWLPYREEWPVDRNKINDGIHEFYGVLIERLKCHPLFHTFYSEDGGLGNYLEFICYPHGHGWQNGNAVLVCVSLCAPLAAYGQTTYRKTDNSFSWGGLFHPNHTGLIQDVGLREIEKEIKMILLQKNLQILGREFVSKPLPTSVVNDPQYENHNKGGQYLHGLFQKMD